MNQMVRRLKWFSLSTLAFTAISVPIFAYQNDDPRWTTSTKATFLTFIVGSSLASTMAFHVVAGKYVFRVRIPTPLSPTTKVTKQTPLCISTMSFWGTNKDIPCTVGDIERVEKGLCTWRVNNQSLFLALPKKTDKESDFSRLLQVVRE